MTTRYEALRVTTDFTPRDGDIQNVTVTVEVATSSFGHADAVASPLMDALALEHVWLRGPTSILPKGSAL